MSWLACLVLANLPQLPLERWRPQLDRLEERTATGEWAVPDETVAQLERDLGALLALPEPWRVELRPPAGVEREPARIACAQVGSGPREFDLLHARVRGRLGCSLELHAAFDLQWLSLGSTVFIGANGATTFSRAQFAERADFFPQYALPIVLARIDDELRALPLDGLEAAYLDFDSASPLLPKPSMRCALTVRAGPEPLAFRAYFKGDIQLPTSAAHLPGFAFTGTQRCRDPFDDDRTPRPSFAARARDAFAPLALKPVGDAWNLSVFDHGWGALSAYVWLDDGPKRREPEDRWLFEVLASSTATEVGGERLEFTLGGVPASLPAARAILEALHSQRDVANEMVFSVTGYPALRAVDVVFAPRTMKRWEATAARGLRFTLSNAGEIARRDAFTVHSITSDDESAFRHWKCTLTDGANLELWIPTPIFCWTDEDRIPRGRIENKTLGVVGGAVFRELN